MQGKPERKFIQGVKQISETAVKQKLADISLAILSGQAYQNL